MKQSWVRIVACLVLLWGAYYTFESFTEQRPSILRFRIPKGTWGYFALVEDKSVPSGTFNIDVPVSGRGPKVPPSPYIFERVEYSDGTEIYNSETDPNPFPNVSDDTVKFQWIQMSDYGGMTFFVGTEKQFSQTYTSPPLLGLKPVENKMATSKP